MRKRARTDGNHKQITAVLKACGCQVLDMSTLGGGAPDIAVCLPGRRAILMVEIKDGSKPPSERKLTPDQHAFHALWPVWVIETEEQAIALVGGKVQ